jgi:hypothetical protein
MLLTKETVLSFAVHLQSLLSDLQLKLGVKTLLARVRKSIQDLRQESYPRDSQPLALDATRRFLRPSWEDDWILYREQFDRPLFTGWMQWGEDVDPMVRDAFVAVFGALAAFLVDEKEDRLKREQAGELRQALVVFINRLGLPTGSRSGDRRIEARDKWIYARCCEGVPHSKIAAELKKVAREKGWRVVSSKQGIHQIGEKYAEAHGLPAPPPRQSR